MSIKHFIQEIEKGLQSSVYLLYAEDPFLLKEASIMSSHTMPQAERDFCFDAFDLDDNAKAQPLEQMLDVANMMPFMGKRRVVVLENIQAIAKKNMAALENYISNPSPCAVMLLLHKGGIKAQFKDMVKKTKAISLDIRPQDLPLYIKEKARLKGFEITDKAIGYLMDMEGHDAGLISSEVEKFALVGKSRIDVQDIIGLVKASSDYNAFDLVNALKERDTDRVFKIAKSLQETTETYGLTGAINWHYSRMASNDKGRNRAYYDRVFGLLNEADIRVKTSGGTFPLEYLLIKLLRA